MAQKRPAIVLVKVNGEYVRSVAGTIVLVDSEPSTFDVTLSNWDRSYGPSSAIAQIRNTEPLILTAQIVERVSAGGLAVWDSPEFIVEDYEVGGPIVTLSGRCRLAELDQDDQFVVWDEENQSATVETGGLAEILAAIASQAGLTVAGAGSRTVRDYNLAGNLLTLFGDAVYPLQKYRMGSGSEIVLLSAPTGSHSYTDKDHLKAFRFRRSRYVRNQAVVERIEASGGRIVLASADREAATGLAGVSDLIALSEPSRSLHVEWECARGEMYWSAYDESGNPLNPPLQPLTNASYQGAVLATHVRFSYYLHEDADNGDDWKQRYKYTVWGWPAGATPPPVSGFAKTGNAGTGPRRRYPEPFSLPSIDNGTDAQAAANAIAEEGNLEGSSMKLELVLTADVPMPYSTVNVVDSATPYDGSGVVRTTTIAWGERKGDKNGIDVEAGVSE